MAKTSSLQHLLPPPPQPVATLLAEISFRSGGGAFLRVLVGSEAGNASD